MEEGRTAFKILTGTPAIKIPLGRPMRRWGDNIRIDLNRDRDRDYWRVLGTSGFHKPCSQ